ncbi:hypothetical protein CCYA_CCYA04G1388 [Cyanidiococcus yangmingshanensis]|nr:hypothetical protein CCYA_CCYA04G1388 [Cyanidiococcus yangmingshanensis]
MEESPRERLQTFTDERTANREQQSGAPSSDANHPRALTTTGAAGPERTSAAQLRTEESVEERATRTNVDHVATPAMRHTEAEPLGAAMPTPEQHVTSPHHAVAHLLSTIQNPTARPPFPLLTTDAIQLILDENYDLIRAICAAQELGRVEHCAALGSRLHANLVYLATVADHQPANTPGLAGIAAANTIAATEKAAAAQELQVRAQIPRHASADAAASIAAKMAIGAAAMAKNEALETLSETPPASSVRRKRIRSEAAVRFWTAEEHAKFLELVHDPACRTEDGRYNVSLMSQRIGTRDNKQVRSHLQKYLLKKQQQLQRTQQ